MHIFPDDITVKTTGAEEIYPKLAIFEECGKIIYKIHIRWGKIEIIPNEQEYATYAMRKQLPGNIEK